MHKDRWCVNLINRFRFSVFVFNARGKNKKVSFDTLFVFLLSLTHDVIRALIGNSPTPIRRRGFPAHCIKLSGESYKLTCNQPKSFRFQCPCSESSRSCHQDNVGLVKGHASLDELKLVLL